MSTDWVQVAVCLIWGLGIGGLLFKYADGFARLQQRGSRATGTGDRFAGRATPALVRFVATGFLVFGIVGAIMGLFFADKM